MKEGKMDPQASTALQIYTWSIIYTWLSTDAVALLWDLVHSIPVAE